MPTLILLALGCAAPPSSPTPDADVTTTVEAELTAGTDADRCVEEVTEVDPSDASALGFSADDILASATGTRTAPFTWQETGPPVDLGFEATAADAPVLLHTWSPASGDPAVECALPTLEVAIDAHVWTSDGTLDESWRAAATSSDFQGVTSFLLERPVAEIEGTLDTTSLASVSIWNVINTGTANPAEMYGTVDGVAGGSGGRCIGRWNLPANEFCEE